MNTGMAKETCDQCVATYLPESHFNPEFKRGAYSKNVFIMYEWPRILPQVSPTLLDITERDLELLFSSRLASQNITCKGSNNFESSFVLFKKYFIEK